MEKGNGAMGDYLPDMTQGPSVRAIEIESTALPISNILNTIDPLDMNRHIFTKGRMEFTGHGRVCFTQGHNAPGYDNNNRKPGYGYSGFGSSGRDKYATEELGVDVEEY